MTSRETVAEALAFFETTDDIGLLHQLVAEVAPRARRMVGQYLARGAEDAIPPPSDLRPARHAATAAAALKALRSIDDFALLQGLARSIGRRIETIEIAASADFPVGARVTVPAKVAFPRTGAIIGGVVETTGTMLQIHLDNGETWHGPPSLARLETAS